MLSFRPTAILLFAPQGNEFFIIEYRGAFVSKINCNFQALPVHFISLPQFPGRFIFFVLKTAWLK
jgi:hypothetical protein